MVFVSGGRLDFVIVADVAEEARIMKSNATQASIAPAVEVLVEAFRRTTGQTRKPVVTASTSLTGVDHHNLQMYGILRFGGKGD